MRLFISLTLACFILLAGFSKDVQARSEKPDFQAPMAVEVYGTIIPITVGGLDNSNITWADLYPYVPKDLIKKNNTVQMTAQHAYDRVQSKAMKSLKNYEAELETLSNTLKDVYKVEDEERRKFLLGEQLMGNGGIYLQATYPNFEKDIRKAQDAALKHAALMLIGENITSYIEIVKTVKENERKMKQKMSGQGG
ncbi:MAG: hypothetical protein AAF244_05405 [Pseudomonadota bacterium]